VVDTVSDVIRSLSVDYTYFMKNYSGEDSSAVYRLQATNIPFTRQGDNISVDVRGTDLTGFITSVAYKTQLSNHHGGGEHGVDLIDSPVFDANSRFTLSLKK
jgi:hypothetical protein